MHYRWLPARSALISEERSTSSGGRGSGTFPGDGGHPRASIEKPKHPVTSRDLGQAANYLYMLFGEVPRPEEVRGLETYLNTVVDHGLNASTFTARVIISTGSDLVSAVVGAIGV